MKRFIVIIFILLVILICLVINKNLVLGNEIENISVQEVQKIETYISKIYTRKDGNLEAIPEFETISGFDNIWIWEVLKQNIGDNYELQYGDFEEQSKEIFGPSFNLVFPKDGITTFEYMSELGYYVPTNTTFNNENSEFILDKIEKVDGGYIVQIVEYIEQYLTDEEQTIILKDTQGNIIGTTIIENQASIKEMIKSEEEKFTKKEIYLKEINGEIYIEKCRKI